MRGSKDFQHKYECHMKDGSALQSSTAARALAGCACTVGWQQRVKEATI